MLPRWVRRRHGRHAAAGRGGAVAAVGAVVVSLAGVAVAATGDGMLRPSDVGLERITPPHRATVVAIDLVKGKTCAPAADDERDGRIQSFSKSRDRSAGAVLNQIVFDFPSRDAAKTWFAKARANERQRAACGKTKKAGDLSYADAPSGVGDQRFTVTANETISGEVRSVRAVHVLDDTHVHELVFIDWNEALPSTTVVARRAAQQLS